MPLTPNVDLLLECNFSYMHRGDNDDNDDNEDVQKAQLFHDPEDEFLSPLIGPEEEEEAEEEEKEVGSCFCRILTLLKRT